VTVDVDVVVDIVVDFIHVASNNGSIGSRSQHDDEENKYSENHDSKGSRFKTVKFGYMDVRMVVSKYASEW